MKLSIRNYGTAIDATDTDSEPAHAVAGDPVRVSAPAYETHTSTSPDHQIITSIIAVSTSLFELTTASSLPQVTAAAAAATTSPSSTHAPQREKDSLGGGDIAGMAVGIVAAVAIIAFLCFLIGRNRVYARWAKSQGVDPTASKKNKKDDGAGYSAFPVGATADVRAGGEGPVSPMSNNKTVSEMDSSRPLAEAEGRSSRYELAGSPVTGPNTSAEDNKKPWPI